MTTREALLAAIAAMERWDEYCLSGKEYNESERGFVFTATTVPLFPLVRDHGPALLAALDDAERVNYLESLPQYSLLEIEDDSNYGLPPGKHVVMNDDNDERLGSGAMVREAIDDAMRSCPSGTNGSLELIAERAAIDAARKA